MGRLTTQRQTRGYLYPYWGVGYLYRGSVPREVAEDMVNEVFEQIARESG